MFAGEVYSNTEVSFSKMRVVLPPPVASGTAGYGIIKNHGKSAIKIVGFKSNAGDVTLHRTESSGGMVSMKHLDSFTLQSGESLELKPLSYHLMFMRIDHDVVKKNGSIRLHIEFEGSDSLSIIVPVIHD